MYIIKYYIQTPQEMYANINSIYLIYVSIYLHIYKYVHKYKYYYFDKC